MSVLGANGKIKTALYTNYFSSDTYISEFKNKSAMKPGNLMMNFK
jgi:hypothetical protein